MLSYRISTECGYRRWAQHSFPDGRPFWGGVQLDEMAFPVILAAKLAEHGESGRAVFMIRRAIHYIVHIGPITAPDRWEENAGVSPFTLAIEIAALVGAADFFDDRDERMYCLSLADYWNERIEDWTYIDQGPLAQPARRRRLL